MAKYSISYTCGHSGVVNLIGRHSSRESRIAYLERGECFECYKTKATKASQQQAQDLELPALVGNSEKQIAWAETLRIQKLADIESKVESLKRGDDEKYRQVLIAVEKIGNETSAKQWIEWRYESPMEIIAEVLQAMLSTPTEEQKQQQLAEQKKAEAIQRAALAEATIRPASPVANIAAEITLTGNVISVSFPERNEDFNEIVKSLGHIWRNGHWQRTLDSFAGSPVDRAVEMGYTLLARGFPIRIFDETLRAKVVVGEFEPEQTRWISTLIKGEYIGWFAIWWGRHEDYYGVARRLKHSKYYRPLVVVPPEQFEQVLDFAQKYGFRLAQAAQEVVQCAKEDKDKMLVVAKATVALRTKMLPVAEVPPLLTVPASVDIADELRDD